MVSEPDIVSAEFLLFPNAISSALVASVTSISSARCAGKTPQISGAGKASLPCRFFAFDGLLHSGTLLYTAIFTVDSFSQGTPDLLSSPNTKLTLCLPARHGRVTTTAGAGKASLLCCVLGFKGDLRDGVSTHQEIFEE